MVYQPHRYTRTRDLFEDFVEVLSKNDQLVLLDVYSAGEQAIVGADSRSLARSIRNRGEVDPVFATSLEEVPKILENILEPNDILITQGAGNVSQLVSQLSDTLFKRGAASP